VSESEEEEEDDDDDDEEEDDEEEERSLKEVLDERNDSFPCAESAL